jgi:hypothetical protein
MLWAGENRRCILRAALWALTVVLCAGPAAARWYELEDWISYGVFREVTSIDRDDRCVYFGTTGGVMRYDYWKESWDAPLTTSSGLLDNHVLGVAVDPDAHEIIFSTRLGTCRFDPFLERFRIGGYWTQKTSDSGFQYPELIPDFDLNFYRDAGGAYLTDAYLRRYTLTAHLADDWGYLWIGTAGLGAGRASLRTGRLKMLHYGLMGTNVTAAAFDGDQIWAGGIHMWDDAAGITRASRDLQSWEYFEAPFIDGLRSADVTAFAPGENGVWVGTLYGLSRYDKETGGWLTLSTFQGLADDWVTDIVLDEGHLWAGTSRGATLVSVEGDSVLVTEIPAIGTQKVYDIEPGADFIWFGTEEGVFALDKSMERWLKFTSPDGTIERAVTAISVFEDEVWFATGVGLTVYRRSSEQWQWHPFGEQIQAGHIICLKAGPKAVWAGTEAGLWKLRRQTGRWRVFTTEDGLADDRIQAILLDGAYIWLGTPGGLTRFYWDNPLRID